jgi:hypothetical protein
MPAGVPPEAERLYGLPLEQFVQERNALARELRSEDRREDADRVAALRRPPLAVWAINQLARVGGKELDRLLVAGDRLRAGDVDAADELSAAVDTLVRQARKLLDDAGHAASDATAQRIASTLRAAPADEANAEALRSGQLTEELEPAGFAAMAALAGTARPPASAKQAEATAADERRGRRLREARTAVDEARKRARELERTADAAEREARKARAEADRAQAEVERAERALGRLR